MVQRQSITAESIYGDEFDADPVVTLSDVESPSEGQNSNPESEDNTSAKDKRHQFLRQNSVLQYMRDQKSIDDDPVNILQKIVSIKTQILECLWGIIYDVWEYMWCGSVWSVGVYLMWDRKYVMWKFMKCGSVCGSRGSLSNVMWKCLKCGSVWSVGVCGSVSNAE